MDGNPLDREKIAAEIDASLIRIPKLPEFIEDCSYIESVLNSRLSEIEEVYGHYGIEISSYTVYCTRHDSARLTNIQSFNEKPVLFYLQFDEVDDLDEEDDGTFLIVVDAIHPVTVWTKFVLGIFYLEKPSIAEWETRWILPLLRGSRRLSA